MTSRPKTQSLHPDVILQRRQRVEDAFLSGYQTTVSIIQGVALSILLTNTFSYLGSQDCGPDAIVSCVRSRGPYAVMSFMAIVMTSYSYTWFVTIYSWTPWVVDIAVPLLLGVWEIIPMFYFGNPVWWWFHIGILCFWGAVAVSYIGYRSKPENEPFKSSPDAYARHTTGIRVLSIAFFLAGLLFVGLSRIVNISPPETSGTWQIIADMLFVVSWCLVLKLESWYLTRLRTALKLSTG